MTPDRAKRWAESAAGFPGAPEIAHQEISHQEIAQQEIPQRRDGVYERLWSALPAPTIAVDADNRVVEANPAAELFFALSRAMLRRRRLQDLAGATSPAVDVARQARKSGVSVSAYGVALSLSEVDALGPDGEPAARLLPSGAQESRLVDVSAAPIYDEPGALLLMIQPRSVAAQMGEAAAGQSASRSLSGLSATLAHEIKNPLFGISGAVQLLEPNLSDADLELARLIHEEIARVRQLLDRMDAFGELGPTERAPVNIHDVLDQARRSASAGYGRHIRFVETYDPSLPPVPGDRAQLLQAAANLVKNAVEAAPRQGGEVHLRTAYRSGVKMATLSGATARLPLEVVIADNGPGVPQELRPHIFEPFITSKGGGSGLGLSLVAKIVADHGGVVDCARRRDRTEFRMLLPVWEDAAALTPEPGAGQGGREGSVPGAGSETV